MLTDRDIAPHVPVSRQTNGRFTRDDFSYDKERNAYLCPGGKLLTSTGNTPRAVSSITALSKVIARPAS